MRMVRIMYELKKWVECDDPAQAAASVVHQALSDRLAAVAHFLEPARPDVRHDPEHVHQLRVATRRAGAALAAFGDFLPRRKSKRMRRKLKQIRQAAGVARDHDVLAGRYSTRHDDLAESAQDWLWARIVDARRAANPAVDEIYREFSQGEFAKSADRLVAKVRWRGDGDEPTFAALATKQLTSAASDFFAAAHRRPTRAAGLHKLRIAGKRFRYSIELFTAISPTLRDEIYPIIEQVQELLGKANDHAVAAERIAAWAKQASGDSAPAGGVDKIAKRERKKAAESRRNFLDWWTVEKANAVAEQFSAIVRDAATSSAADALPRPKLR
jgi:CHAD domain-containing protein